MSEFQIDRADEKSKPETYHQKHRRVLGIPKDLEHAPVLYFSSHKGVHYSLESFMSALPKKEMEGKTSSFVDLSTTSAPEVLRQLSDFIKNPHPDVAPSELLFNIQFLPELDQNGNSREGSHTFAIDPINYKTMLPRMEAFLKDKLKPGEEGKEIKGIKADTKKRITFKDVL